MLNYFWIMDPTMERIVDTGFSPPKDSQNLSLEDEKNFYLNAQATHVIVNALSDVVTALCGGDDVNHRLVGNPKRKV
jgi:hypothetical protein